LFFAGVPYWLRHPDRGVLTLYALVVLTIATLAVLVMPMGSRYVFALYPLLVAGALITADTLIRRLAARLLTSAPGDRPTLLRLRRGYAAVLGLVVLAGWAGNCEFDKVWSSYQRTRAMDHEAALAFIKDHKREGDKIMSVRPQTVGNLLGRADYYILVLVHFDELYVKPTGAVDRWVGAEMAWKTDHFKRIFQQHDRVWLVLDEMRLSQIPPDLLDYLYKQCTVEYDFFGGQVLLWEKSSGRFSTFPNHGGEGSRY
jgi:hypothetical protein